MSGQQLPLPPPVLPPRPQCRAASSRTATVCFWTIFLLFLAVLGFLGLLAYTRETGELLSSSNSLSLGLLLAGCAIAAVIAGICANPHQRHR
jgi:hypothetical protein